MEAEFNEMQIVKRRFFAMRNGVIADVLRRNGSPFRIIFGLNLPQISEIAAEIGKNRQLGERLWANSTTRESMLIAPMLVDFRDFSKQDALRWIDNVPAFEIADILCMKLLRNLPFALELVEKLLTDDETMKRYTALRLMFNLVGKYPDAALKIAEIVLDKESDSRLRHIAASLAEEAKFLLE